MEGESTVGELNSGSRCRKRGRFDRKKDYGDCDPSALLFNKPCCHGNKSKFHCSVFTTKDIVKNRKALYRNVTKIDQDSFLTRYISAYEPMRRRPSNKPPQQARPKQRSATFFLTKNGRPKAVCKRLFLAALSIGRQRVDTLVKRISNGDVVKERRGGDRKSRKSAEKRQKIIEFINKFPAVESHYSRSKSKRIYLSCELNIAKMRKMYNDSVEPRLSAKKSFFRSVFHKNFNIGFQSPASDACTTCYLLKNKIKTSKDSSEKTHLMIEKRVHSMRAKAFYDLMKQENETSVTYCFDLQQVQPLPRTPIQEAFYSRQISFYNFCVVNKNTKNPTFYCWTENQAGRGSTEVGSALFNFLNTKNFEGIDTIKLFCDGCGGQNKNSHIVHLLFFWLQNKSPQNVKKIELTFPTRGHSFLPADRVFGRVEKEIRRYPVITTPEEYIMHYSKFGTVLKLGTNWSLYNIRELEIVYKKLENIQNLKRIHFIKKVTKSNQTKCCIKVFEHYRFTSDEENKEMKILKRGRSHTDVCDLSEAPLHKLISEKKRKDVEMLLEKQFGENWKELDELTWYVNIINNEEALHEEECEEENGCDCLEEEVVVLRI